MGLNRDRSAWLRGSSDIDWTDGIPDDFYRDPRVLHANQNLSIETFGKQLEKGKNIVVERLSQMDASIFNPSTIGFLDSLCRVLACSRFVAGDFDAVQTCKACDKTTFCLRCRCRRADEITSKKATGGASFQQNDDIYHCALHIPESCHPTSPGEEVNRYEFIAAAMLSVKRFLRRTIPETGHQIVFRQLCVHPKRLDSGFITPHIHLLIRITAPSVPSVVMGLIKDKWKSLTERDFGIFEIPPFFNRGDRLHTKPTKRRRSIHMDHFVNLMAYNRRGHKPADTPATIARHAQLCEATGINQLGWMNGPRVDLKTNYDFDPVKLNKPLVIVFDLDGRVRQIPTKSYYSECEKLDAGAYRFVVNNLPLSLAINYLNEMPKQYQPKHPLNRWMTPVPEQIDSLEGMRDLARAIVDEKVAKETLELLTRVMFHVDHRVRITHPAKWLEWEQAMELALRHRNHGTAAHTAKNTFKLGRELILRFHSRSRHRLNGIPAGSPMVGIAADHQSLSFNQLLTICEHACVNTQALFDPQEWRDDEAESKEVVIATSRNLKSFIQYARIAQQQELSPGKLANLIKANNGRATSGRPRKPESANNGKSIVEPGARKTSATLTARMRRELLRAIFNSTANK